MEENKDEIEVIVQSVLPADCPQGRLRIIVPRTITVEGLMRQVCKEASVPLLPSYVLKNAINQILPPLETLANVEVTTGSILHWDDQDITRTSSIRSWCNVWWFICLIALIIGAVGIIAITIIKTREPKVPYSYGIVFDAGSSHTSMYVYRWNGMKLNETAVASQFGEPCTPPVAGISHFTSDPEEGRRVMKFCLDKAKDTIPSNSWSKTPVYLGATAGMRMLNEVNRTITDIILNVIREAASEYPFKYNSSNIRIISGEEEGTFSWITSNYVSGVFHVIPITTLLTETVETKTTGALDMGGASAQITFIPSKETIFPQQYLYDLSLYGSNYSLYTHSFLCYGSNEAARRYRAALIQSQNFSVTIEDPCAPEGWQKNFTSSDIFMAPCVSGQHALDTFGFTILPDSSVDQDTVFLFEGTSDLKKCQQFVPEHLFNFSAPCNFSSCSFNGQFQPPVTGDFYAFSSFYYVTNFLNLTDGIKKFTLAEMQDAIAGFCNKTWNEVKKIPAAKPSAIPTYCFQSNFVEAILTRGYGFNTANWDTLHFVDKVANTKIGWSLGFMLSKSNGIPVNTLTTSLTNTMFILLVILFALFLLAAVGFACHARRYRTAKSRRHYSRLAEYGSL